MSGEDDRVIRRMVSLAFDPYMKSDRKLRRLHYRASLSILDEESMSIRRAINDLGERMDALAGIVDSKEEK